MYMHWLYYNWWQGTQFQLCFCLSFHKTKIWKSINTLMKKIAGPGDGFCPKRRKISSFPVSTLNMVCVVVGASFLKHRAAIAR